MKNYGFWEQVDTTRALSRTRDGKLTPEQRDAYVAGYGAGLAGLPDTKIPKRYKNLDLGGAWGWGRHDGQHGFHPDGRGERLPPTRHPVKASNPTPPAEQGDGKGKIKTGVERQRAYRTRRGMRSIDIGEGSYQLLRDLCERDGIGVDAALQKALDRERHSAADQEAEAAGWAYLLAVERLDIELHGDRAGLREAADSVSTAAHVLDATGRAPGLTAAGHQRGRLLSVCGSAWVRLLKERDAAWAKRPSSPKEPDPEPDVVEDIEAFGFDAKAGEKARGIGFAKEMGGTIRAGTAPLSVLIRQRQR